ncbi:MAG: nuclear transport factor 2 family protein [Capnocytophaga sp.]|nr:nuclear transport factor 2 family protein [Capnocytophaga sp.]
MKVIATALLGFCFAFFPTEINAQKNQKFVKKENSVEQRLQQIEDKMALKNLVDTFSNLADVKDVKNQMFLFTEDAIVEANLGGRVSKSQGRDEIFKGFTYYLDLFDLVYHSNGQQVVDIKGDTATGIAYCTVLLIGNQEGKRTATTHYIIYNDTYVKRGGKWYISHRKSNFVHTEVKEIGSTDRR